MGLRHPVAIVLKTNYKHKLFTFSLRHKKPYTHTQKHIIAHAHTLFPRIFSLPLSLAHTLIVSLPYSPIHPLVCACSRAL